MQCVDASVAVKWIFPEQCSSEALALYRDCAERRERIIGPPLLPIEVANTIRQRMRRGSLSAEEGAEILTAFLAIPVTVSPATPAGLRSLHEEALALACRFDLPTVYDAYYLALSVRRGCPLWTDDARLLRAVGGQLDVRLIGDYGVSR